MKHFNLLKGSLLAAAAVATMWTPQSASACTGVSFKAADGSYVAEL